MRALNVTFATEGGYPEVVLSGGSGKIGTDRTV
jgi:hypothetical protein